MNKEKKKGSIFVNIILIASVIMLAVAGFKLYQYFNERKSAEDDYKKLSKEVKRGRKINWKKLKKINPQVVGWIYVRGTNIDYPIVKAKNNEKYLHRSFRGYSSVSGAIFLDEDCKKNFTSQHNIIYGHHMNNGTMFASLMKFRDQSFYKKHKTIMIYTPKKTITLHAFSCYARQVYGVEIPITFGNEKKMKKYIKNIISRSDIEANKRDKRNINRIYTLVTCSYEESNTRTFVHAREVSIIKK